MPTNPERQPTATNRQHYGPGGITGVPLSPEARQKAITVRRARAAERAAAKERAKLGLHAQIAHELETRAHEIVQAYLAAGLERGDWRALDALADRHLGRPTQRVETHATAADALADMSPDRLDELARQALRALEQAAVDEAEASRSSAPSATVTSTVSEP